MELKPTIMEAPCGGRKEKRVGGEFYHRHGVKGSSISSGTFYNGGTRTPNGLKGELQFEEKALGQKVYPYSVFPQSGLP